MFKLLPGLSYVGSSHTNHTGQNAKFQSKEVQGPKTNDNKVTSQSMNMRIIENNEQFMPYCILHLAQNNVPGTAHPAKRKKSTGVLPPNRHKEMTNQNQLINQNHLTNQNHLAGQGNDRNEDMTFAQHLAQALLLSREDKEMTERLESVPTYLVTLYYMYNTQVYWVHFFVQKFKKIKKINLMKGLASIGFVYIKRPNNIK